MVVSTGPDDVVARSNEHLRHLHGRRLRWTTGHHGEDNRSSVQEDPRRAPLPAVNGIIEETNASAATSTNTQTTSPLIIELDGDEEKSEDDASEAGAQPVTRQEHTAKMHWAPPLVQYDTPPTMYNITTAPSNPRVAARKSTQQPLLPSPAPSDENATSPTLAESHITAMRDRSSAQRVATDLAADSRPSTSGSPSAVQSPGLPPPPIRHISVGQDVRVRSVVSPPYPAGLQSRVTQYPMHAPASGVGQHQTSGGYTMPYQPSTMSTGGQGQLQQNTPQVLLQQRPMAQPNGQPLSRPPSVPSNSGHAHSHSSHPAASRVSKEVLLRRLSEKQFELEHALSPFDGGRLALLRTAVERDDWFYQVLSQLFCVRSAMPALLPKSLKTIPPSSWQHVENMLCPNSEINKDLLDFFAEFPEPIMDLYSDMSNARNVFENQAAEVRTFLIALPQYWESVLYQSRRRLAPPLVQEMTAELHLRSVVLQTTCFRAIMRTFWGIEDSPGTDALLNLHDIDQGTYYAYGWRRNEQELREAHAALRRAFEAWTEYQRRQALGSPLPFVMPNDVQQVFRRPPRQQQQQQQQQQQSQQRQPHVPPLLRQGQSLGQPVVQPVRQQPQTMQPQAMQPHAMQPQGMRPNAQNIALRSPTLPSTGSSPHLQPQPAPRRASGPSSLGPAHTLRNGTAAPRQPLQQMRPLFPPPGYSPSQPTDPDPNTSCLQQAHLRSPTLVPADLEPNAPRLYRYVAGFALPPATIKKRLAVQQAVFEISAEEFGKIAETTPAPPHTGAPSTRVIGEASLMYRLRCCAVPPTGFPSESSWIIADNSWPHELCFELNDTLLQTRRKLHFGKYLPVDVTLHVKLGTNKLKLFLNRPAEDKKKFDFAVAIETIGVMNHGTIKQSLKRVSAQDSLLTITKSLTGTGGLADDDVTVTSSNVTISIVEPLSQARMVDLPVRGKNCLHKDVFDFEVFLSVCKPRDPHDPSLVDSWRCPLCRGDIRPHTLVVDEFLLHVRNALEQKGSLDTKAIVVESDGSWKPKAEERTGVPSPSLEREERTSASAQPIEVIELD